MAGAAHSKNYVRSHRYAIIYVVTYNKAVTCSILFSFPVSASIRGIREDPFTGAKGRPPARSTRPAAYKRKERAPPARERRRQAVKEDRSSGVSNRLDPADDEQIQSALVPKAATGSQNVSEQKG